MPTVDLIVDGEARRDWTSVEISRGIEQLATTFTFQYTESNASIDRPLPFDEGDPCQIRADGVQILDGFIDDLDISYDDTNHSIRVSGRTKTGDLVDCSAIHKSGSWKEVQLSRIVEDICKPFDIAVVEQVENVDQFDKFSIQDGETAYEAIQRACNLRGVLPITNEFGDVVLTTAGTKKIGPVIQSGVNVISGNRSGQWRERFQIYIVKSQSAGNNNFFAKDASGPFFRVDDAGIDRYRPLILVAEGRGTGKRLEKRARWERNRRVGESQTYNFTVREWFHDDGLWLPNEIVRVRDDFLRVDEDLLIVAVRYAKDNDGTRSEITLMEPGAFDTVNNPVAKSRNKKSKPARRRRSQLMQ